MIQARTGTAQMLGASRVDETKVRSESAIKETSFNAS
jgi:hypothetical protein